MARTPSEYLVRQLRRRRERERLTQDEWGARLHYTGQHVSAVELGKRPALPDYLEAVDRQFGTDLVDYYLECVKDDPTPVWLLPWLDYEKRATALRSVEFAVIPGLLQTEQYARTLLASGLLDEVEIEEWLAIRLGRQAAVLHRDRPPLCMFVIEQSALLRGPVDVMREQLQHIAKLSEQPRCSVQVVPAGTGLYLGQAGAFALASFDEGDDVGYVDDQLEGRVAVDSKRVATLNRTWNAIRAVALPGDLSRDLILKLVDEL